MAKLIVGHPFWGRGGAEIAAARLLQALVPAFQVDVVTRGGWELRELDEAAGTNLEAGAIRVRRPPLADLRRGGAFWLAAFARYCREIAGEYDLCITASRVIDWGQPAIHFLTDVTWNRELQVRFASPELAAEKGPLRSTYWALSRWLGGVSGRDPRKHDLFIANSRWTASQAQEFCARPLEVIYPPLISLVTAGVHWERRDDAFAWLGRISPEKRIEEAIATLAEVRRTVSQLKLNIVGAFDESQYARRIRARCAEAGDWITVYENLYGRAKDRLLGACRYGISTCEVEAFGMSTAEMLQAGMIPFVPRNGGQAEIVTDERVIFHDRSDAVAKIGAIVSAPEAQRAILQRLSERRKDFSASRFGASVCATIGREVERVRSD